jgi:hypothetical protein
MSLTIRMRRALAAFRADPAESIVIAGNKAIPRFAVVSVPSNTAQVSRHLETVGHEMTQQDSPDWKIHSAYHRSRVIHGKRLNWHINGKGKQSAQYGTTMYYGSNVRQLFRGLGLKDTW